MSHAAFLPTALEEAQTFARSQSAQGFIDWSSFVISEPGPVTHGIWRAAAPGVQVMILEAFPCLGNRPLVPLVRPTGIRFLKGLCSSGILHGRGSLDDVETSTISAGGTSFLSLPGTRYRFIPIGDPCIFLVVRLHCFPRATAPEPCATVSLDPRVLSAFKRQVAGLLEH